MKKWGVLVSLYYAVIVLLLLMPATIIICDLSYLNVRGYFGILYDYYTRWPWLVPVLVLVGGQVLLLTLSVDTSFRRNKPRAHIFVSMALIGLFVTILGFATVISLLFGIKGDHVGDGPNDYTALYSLIFWPLFWIFWTAIFYFRARKMENPFSRAVSWLIRGSILELLVAVSCHVITRRRHDCSAPLVTSFGICTGIAIMLLAFGPGAYVLYKNRLAKYSARA